VPLKPFSPLSPRYVPETTTNGLTDDARDADDDDNDDDDDTDKWPLGHYYSISKTTQ